MFSTDLSVLFIHPSIHHYSLTQQTFIKSLLCAKMRAKSWDTAINTTVSRPSILELPQGEGHMNNHYHPAWWGKMNIYIHMELRWYPTVQSSVVSSTCWRGERHEGTPCWGTACTKHGNYQHVHSACHGSHFSIIDKLMMSHEAGGVVSS